MTVEVSVYEFLFNYLKQTKYFKHMVCCDKMSPSSLLYLYIINLF